LNGDDFRTVDFSNTVINTTLYGISPSGDIVGTETDAPAPGKNIRIRGFLLREGEFSRIDFPGAMWTLPTMIIEDRIVGGYFDNNFTAHGFLLSDGQFQQIDCPGSTSTFTSGMDVHGNLYGRFVATDGVQHGTMVRNGNCIAIDFPGGTLSYANAATPDGDIVGRYTSSDGKVHGFLLTRHE
jgi:hypothetical protein